MANIWRISDKHVKFSIGLLGQEVRTPELQVRSIPELLRRFKVIRIYLKSENSFPTINKQIPIR